MLEEIWVKKYIKVNFDRFEYRIKLHVVDWPLDTLTEEHNRQKKHRNDDFNPLLDTTSKELMHLLRSTNYHLFRKHIKKHS
jgi:hypothetical protein